MRTFIKRVSPRSLFKDRTSSINPTLSLEEEFRLGEKLASLPYYPKINELPNDLLEITEDGDLTLTRRIKYARGSNIIGDKLELQIFVEVQWQESYIFSRRIFAESKIRYRRKRLWIPSEAITFDFSDEIEETIYECS